MRLLNSGFATASLCLVSLLGTGAAVAKDNGNGHGNDASSCSAFYGPFSSQTGEPCTSPIGLCTHGALGGEYPAQYDFTFETLESANDDSDPTKFVYTGTSVVTPLDGSGVLYTEDTGVIHIPTDGTPSPFVTKAIIVEGTKKNKKTSGGFVATGNLVFETGLAVGSFSAVLCDGKGKN
jgi:hypothetical protein